MPFDKLTTNYGYWIKEIYASKVINPTAKNLLPYIFSKTENWKFYKKEIARSIGITDKTLRKTIQRIENKFNVTLFERRKSYYQLIKNAQKQIIDQLTDEYELRHRKYEQEGNKIQTNVLQSDKEKRILEDVEKYQLGSYPETFQMIVLNADVFLKNFRKNNWVTQIDEPETFFSLQKTQNAIKRFYDDVYSHPNAETLGYNNTGYHVYYWKWLVEVRDESGYSPELDWKGMQGSGWIDFYYLMKSEIAIETKFSKQNKNWDNAMKWKKEKEVEEKQREAEHEAREATKQAKQVEDREAAYEAAYEAQQAEAIARADISRQARQAAYEAKQARAAAYEAKQVENAKLTPAQKQEQWEISHAKIIAEGEALLAKRKQESELPVLFSYSLLPEQEPNDLNMYDYFEAELEKYLKENVGAYTDT